MCTLIQRGDAHANVTAAAGMCANAEKGACSSGEKKRPDVWQPKCVFMRVCHMNVIDSFERVQRRVTHTPAAREEADMDAGMQLPRGSTQREGERGRQTMGHGEGEREERQDGWTEVRLK